MPKKLFLNNPLFACQVTYTCIYFFFLQSLQIFSVHAFIGRVYERVRLNGACPFYRGLEVVQAVIKLLHNKLS